LSFRRTRITGRIRIVHGAQLHLVACVANKLKYENQPGAKQSRDANGSKLTNTAFNLCGVRFVFIDEFMISNERPSPYGRQPYRQPYHQPYAPQPPRPFVQEDTLKAGEIQIERKFFVLTLKENSRGRFLRISEEVGGKRSTIIIPATGLKDFKNLLSEMVKVSDEIPAKSETAGK
jgi:hypothetical protein